MGIWRSSGGSSHVARCGRRMVVELGLWLAEAVEGVRDRHGGAFRVHPLPVGGAGRVGAALSGGLRRPRAPDQTIPMAAPGQQVALGHQLRTGLRLADWPGQEVGPGRRQQFDDLVGLLTVRDPRWDLGPVNLVVAPDLVAYL